MSATADAFVAHCVELLSAFGHARAKHMFGGYGLYLDDLFIAIVAEGELFLKVDAHTRPQFEAAGCRAFVYSKAAQAISMGYWSAPEQATESAALLRPWVQLAQAAALRARAGVKRRPRRVP